MLLLGAVVLLALAGLAVDGNWPKVARVSTSFVTYAVVLIAEAGPRRSTGTRIPFWAFALAGGASGLVSGLVRTQVQGAVVVTGVVAGALLLGGIHWLTLTGWRRLLSFSMR